MAAAARPAVPLMVMRGALDVSSGEAALAIGRAVPDANPGGAVAPCNANLPCSEDSNGTALPCVGGTTCDLPPEGLRFTTLGTTGRHGPTSVSGYAGTPLEGQVELDEFGR